MVQFSFLFFVGLAPTVIHATATYNLVKDYSGSTFFNDWEFYDHYDNLTNGDVNFVSASTAQSSQLAYVDSATSHAIIKVDNTSAVPYNEKRNAVRIASSDMYEVGTLWVADFYHIPYGCSVWPAWWSQAPGWPVGGEIDIMEAVNLMTTSQMGLHTTTGCTQVDPVQSSTLINSTNCDHDANNNQGCITTTPGTSYGEGFANSGGGVFVTEFAESGISIWFFPRANVPDAVSKTTSSIDTSALGTPVGNWPNGGCNINEFFSAQQLILDITLCGDFAGASSIFPQTCSGTCYTDYVMGDGSNYANAYFDIDYIRIYGSGSNSVISASNSATGTSSSSGAAASTTTTDAAPRVNGGWMTAVAGVVATLLGML